MANTLEQIRADIANVVQTWIEDDKLRKNDIFVVGCSTSEVLGETIGTAGSEDVAKELFTSLQRLAKEKEIFLAFQCCEHLNRALVVEERIQMYYPLEKVTVKPVRDAGGSMATYAYEHLEKPIVVEHIQAHAGIDIGDTFIGMHLQNVVVPVRLDIKTIGNAHLTAAITRPKLIGGARAVYE